MFETIPKPFIRQPRPLHWTFRMDPNGTINRAMVRKNLKSIRKGARDVKRYIKKYALRHNIHMAVMYHLSHTYIS